MDNQGFGRGVMIRAGFCGEFGVPHMICPAIRFQYMDLKFRDCSLKLMYTGRCAKTLLKRLTVREVYGHSCASGSNLVVKKCVLPPRKR